MATKERKEYVKYLINVFCNKDRCGFNFLINESKMELFLDSLPEDKYKLFKKQVLFFELYTEACFLFIKDAKDRKTLFITSHIWTNLMTLIIFSIIENIIPNNRTIEFKDYLKNNFDKIKEVSDIDKLNDKYFNEYPYKGSTANVVNFFRNNLLQNDKDKVVKLYDKQKQNLSFDQIIGNIYGKHRSGFCHQSKIFSMEPTSCGIDIGEDGTLYVYANLSPEYFIFLSWKAIFKYFGGDDLIEFNGDSALLDPFWGENEE